MKIVKLSADWCAPCNAMQPILSNIFSKIDYKNIPFTDIDIDDDINGYVEKYQVRNIPTILLLDNDGNLLKRITGFISEEKLMKELNEELSKENNKD